MLAACSPGPSAPSAFIAFLDALVDGRTAEAYGMTQLAEIDRASDGSAVSEAHFVAFYDARPLDGYAIENVAVFEPPGDDPFWEIDVTLRTENDERLEAYQVVGRVLPRINVDPAVIHLEVPDTDEVSVTVDGVAVDTADARIEKRPDTWRILLLPGLHELEVAGITLIVSTHPLEVLAGDAEVTDAGEGPGHDGTLRILL